MTRRRGLILLATTTASSMVFLDGTIVNVALPVIGARLPATFLGVLEGQTYVVAGYMGVLAALLLLAGALSDQLGRRRVFLAGVAGFTVASAACGLAPSLELLVVARLVQGAAGALLVPGSLGIITESFEGADRTRAIGTWTAATSLTLVVGPILGAVLVETLGWPAAFLVNVPLGVVTAWVALRGIPADGPSKGRSAVDWLGAAVAAVAVGGLVVGIVRGQDTGWSTPVPIALVGLGLAAAAAFVPLMRRRPDPLVPLGLFRIRAFSAINLVTLFVYGGFYTLTTFQSLYVQGGLGYSPLGAALLIFPLALLLTLLSTWVGALAARHGTRPFLVAGPLLMAAGVLGWLAVPTDSPAWRPAVVDLAALAPPLGVLLGPILVSVAWQVGMVLVVAPLTATLMGSVPVERASLASAVNNAVSRVGQPLVSALVFAAVTSTFYAALAATPGADVTDAGFRAAVQPLQQTGSGVSAAVAAAARTASTDAFHLLAVVCAALFAAGAVAAWVWLPRERRGDAAAGERA